MRRFNRHHLIVLTATSIFGPGEPPAGEASGSTQRPAGDEVPALAKSVYQAADRTGIDVVHAEAWHEPADLAALVQSAREAAVAGAGGRAEGLVQERGTDLSKLICISESASFGFSDARSCLPAGMAGSMEMFRPGTDNA